MLSHPVVILGIGGSLREGSSTERALRISLDAAERLGAHVEFIGGVDLNLPLYDPGTPVRTAQAQRLVRALAAADGLLVATPAYHGTISGLMKNALDYAEDLRPDARPYLSGRAVGCLSVGQGWQGPVSAIAALRSTVHALRGWPTPLGVPVNTETCPLGPDGRCADPRVQEQLEIMGGQVVEFAAMRRAWEASRLTALPAVG